MENRFAKNSIETEVLSTKKGKHFFLVLTYGIMANLHPGKYGSMNPKKTKFGSDDFPTFNWVMFRSDLGWFLRYNLLRDILKTT